MKENPTKPCVCGNYWRTFWTDADGRRRSHSLGPVATLTEPQAKRKWRAWAKTDYLLASRGVTPQTVAAAVSQWIEHCRGYYRRPDGSDTGEASACASALRWLVRQHGDLAPSDLRPSHLEALQIHMAACNVARTTINSYSNRCRRWAKWAVRRDLAPPDLATGWQAVPNLRRGRTDARETDGRPPVGRVVFAVTVDHLGRTEFADLVPLVHLLWHTGARPSELCTMRGEDIDRTTTPWVYRPTRHKTERSSGRVIQFGPQARAHLEPLSALVDGGPCFKVRGQPVTQRILRDSIRHACDLADVEAWTPYQLRHAALERIEEAYGRTGAMRVAGHQAAATTDHYVRVQRANEQQAATIAEEIG